MMSKEYVNAYELQFRDNKDMVEEFCNEIGQLKGKCLDIGCESGKFTAKYILPTLPQNSELVGADVSASMVDYAKQKYSETKCLSFVQLDIESDNLSADEIEQYDNVLSFSCLNWCRNIRQALENIYKLLRTNGKALIMFPCQNHIYESFDKIYENSRFKPYIKDVYKVIQFSQDEDSRGILRKMLEEIGFEILHCSRREKYLIYKDMQTFKNYAFAIAPFTSKIPKDLKEEFENMIMQDITRNRILATSTTNNNNHDNTIFHNYFLLVAYVKKS